MKLSPSIGWIRLGVWALGPLVTVAALVGAGPAGAAGKTTLVIGIDISDTRTFDPARQFEYSPPTTMRAAYETLVTMTPGDYVHVKRDRASVDVNPP